MEQPQGCTTGVFSCLAHVTADVAVAVVQRAVLDVPDGVAGVVAELIPVEMPERLTSGIAELITIHVKSRAVEVVVRDAAIVVNVNSIVEPLVLKREEPHLIPLPGRHPARSRKGPYVPLAFFILPIRYGMHRDI